MGGCLILAYREASLQLCSRCSNEDTEAQTGAGLAHGLATRGGQRWVSARVRAVRCQAQACWSCCFWRTGGGDREEAATRAVPAPSSLPTSVCPGPALLPLSCLLVMLACICLDACGFPGPRRMSQFPAVSGGGHWGHFEGSCMTTQWARGFPVLKDVVIVSNVPVKKQPQERAGEGLSEAIATRISASG